MFIFVDMDLFYEMIFIQKYNLEFLNFLQLSKKEIMFLQSYYITAPLEKIPTNLTQN
jgi:hypothetical protein